MVTEHVKLSTQEVSVVTKANVLVVGSDSAGFTAATCAPRESLNPDDQPDFVAIGC